MTQIILFSHSPGKKSMDWFLSGCFKAAEQMALVCLGENTVTYHLMWINCIWSGLHCPEDCVSLTHRFIELISTGHWLQYSIIGSVVKYASNAYWSLDHLHVLVPHLVADDNSKCISQQCHRPFASALVGTTPFLLGVSQNTLGSTPSPVLISLKVALPDLWGVTSGKCYHLETHFGSLLRKWKDEW